MNDDNKPLRQEDCRAPAALPIDLHISHIDHMIDLDIKQQGPHRSPCNTRTRAFSKPKTNLASTGSFPPAAAAADPFPPNPIPWADLDIADAGLFVEDGKEDELGKRSEGRGRGTLRLRNIWRSVRRARGQSTGSTTGG